MYIFIAGPAASFDEFNVKNMDIRLLIKQLDEGLQFTEFELESIESEVTFLREIKEVVDSFNKQINDLYSKKKAKDYKVCIFDGVNGGKFGRDFQIDEKPSDQKAKLGAKLNLLITKRSIITNHLE